jgi:pyruvate, water dikinase
VNGIAADYIGWFQHLPDDSVTRAGGKGVSLSRMARAGLPVPSGFVVLENSFRAFLESHGGRDIARRLCCEIDVHDSAALEVSSRELRDFIVGRPLPPAVEDAIAKAHGELRAELVAIRSSAVAEDGEAASFAGQQESYLNVRRLSDVILRVKECWASFFSPRALFYRAQMGDIADLNIAVVIQEMVQADKSGVMFTLDPVRGLREQFVVEAVFGLGESIVSGMITPDQYTLARADGALVSEYISEQTEAIVHDPENDGTRHSRIENAGRVLADCDLRRLWAMGVQLESLFGRPQDIEWAIRGEKLYLLQSRPITAMGTSV